jgi:RNA polymerase sigma-70 factor, ECF subfamily
MSAPNDGLPEWKVERLKEGDEKTWRKLLDEHNPWITGFIRHRAHGQDDIVEELVQETWCQAVRSLDHYEIGTSFPVWLMRIAANCWRRFRYRRIQTSPSLDEWPDDRFDEAELDAAIGFAAFIKSKLDLLRERDRDIIIRYYLDGLDIDRVAEEFGLTSGSMKRAIGRARARLRDLLEPYRLQLLPHHPRRCLPPIEPAREPE